MKKNRSFFQVGALEGEELEKGRRIIEISPEAARKMGISEGDVLECVNPDGAPLRVWARISNKLKEFSSRTGILGIKLLKIKPGDQVEIRRVAEV
jgi:anaerobic selenocysteine-containing dehydrogenase